MANTFSSTTQPSTLNILSPLGFKFSIKRLPNVSYFCQNVQIPSISVGFIDVNNPLAVIPVPGSRLLFDPLNIRFRVNQDLKNYLEIYNWLVGLGHPVSLDQTKAFSKLADIPKARSGTASSYVSDGTLTILNSFKNPTHYVFFKDLFPTSLSELVFDSTQADVEYLESTVTFKYLRYEIETI